MGYIEEELAQLDYNTEIKEANESGRAEGREEGREEERDSMRERYESLKAAGKSSDEILSVLFK